MKVKKLLRDNHQGLIVEIKDKPGEPPIKLQRSARMFEKYLDREVEWWACEGKFCGYDMISIKLKEVKHGR